MKKSCKCAKSQCKCKKMEESMSDKKNWIAGAIKKPGALRAELHIKKGKKIPVSKLKIAAKKKGIEGKRANLALTLSKLRKKK